MENPETLENGESRPDLFVSSGESITDTPVSSEIDGNPIKNIVIPSSSTETSHSRIPEQTTDNDPFFSDSDEEN
jgi:hypothetical protein